MTAPTVTFHTWKNGKAFSDIVAVFMHALHLHLLGDLLSDQKYEKYL